MTTSLPTHSRHAADAGGDLARAWLYSVSVARGAGRDWAVTVARRAV